MKVIEIPIGDGQVAKLTRPDRDDFPANLGGAVQYALASVIVWLAETSGEAFGAFGGSALVSFLEHIEPSLVEYYSPLIEQLRQVEGIPKWFDKFLDRIQHPTDEVASAVGQAVLGSAAGGVTGSLLGVLLSPLTYGLNDQMRPARPPLPDLLAMTWRDLLDDPTIADWLADQGWPEKAIEAYKELLRPRPGVSDLIDWAWRVHQDPEVLREELTKRGYEADDIDKFMEIAKLLPGPSDLVTFALREVWREDLRPELLTPYPPERYFELMQKQGFSRDFAEDYWAAHWRLPSVIQGYEMFWRLPEFTEQDLRDLMTRLDILPRYHDELIKIAYRPYTRVDVRRMHKVGILSDEELVAAYMDLGFDREKAENMALFTIRWNLETEEEFTKAEILAGYRMGMLSFDDAVALFESIGRSREYARYVLTLEDYKRQKALINERIRYIRTLYINGELDRTGVTSELGKLDIEAERINRLIEEWDIRRTAKIARPTMRMLEEYYKEDIISEEEARRELHKRRYPDYVIDWIIADWDAQIVDAARKEAERAQKEQERIAKAEFRTKRMVALANLNTQIAEARLHIAELKLAMYYVEEKEDRRPLEKMIAELKVIIRELQLEKAKIPVVLETRHKGGSVV